ncbi:MAG: NAD(+) synthase, partial [Clostridia bacterium]|nr:NAD(+) synthase [Clostridia bacterium]
MKDILRASVISPSLKVADVSYNLTEILKRVNEAKKAGAAIALFPELSLTGYTCGDLFAADLLLDAAKDALCHLAAEMPTDILVAVGAPLELDGALYNTAVLLANGQILGAVPKTALDTAEKRLFTSGASLGFALCTVGGHTFPLGTDLVFRAPDGTVVGVELCQDLFAPLPASTRLALGGAEVILNLSA